MNQDYVPVVLLFCWCSGHGYAKLSQSFRVSRTGVRSVIKKFKESHTVQNKPGRARKQNIEKEN